MDSNTNVIGPELPPHLNKQNSLPSSSANKERIEEEETKLIGPQLPPNLVDKQKPLDSDKDCKVESTSSSTISPSFKKTDGESNILRIVNPSLLPHSTTTDENVPSSSTVDAYGPALPPHLKQSTSVPEEQFDSDDDGLYGPLPEGVSSTSQVHRALEERALEIKLGHLDNKEDHTKSRDEWMTELPNVRVASNLGLGPRQFRKNQMADFSDRSSWTDTPEQKAKKLLGKSDAPLDLKKEAELRAIAKRDAEQSEMIDKHNKKKKRDKSLVEMHLDELKKKKKVNKEAGVPTRRPFSRDIDLKVNQFDEAQKKSIMKKAMHLDDRFSKGQSKYL